MSQKLNSKVKSLKLGFRDAVNKITGKQDLINKYFELIQQLSNIADRLPSGSTLKETILTELRSIGEEKWVDTGDTFYADSVNPYKMDVKKLKRKIGELESVVAAAAAANVRANAGGYNQGR